MFRGVFTALAAALIAVAATQANAAGASAGPSTVSPQPNAGNYHADVNITSATAGCQPFFQSGSYESGYLRYPGPGKTGAEAHIPFSLPPYTSYKIITVIFVPATPATGVKSWSGKMIAAIFPGNTIFSGSFTASFTFDSAKSGNSTFTDPDSFFAAIDLTFANCKVKLGSALVRTGPF